MLLPFQQLGLSEGANPDQLRDNSMLHGMLGIPRAAICL